mmetsp:Transcript_17539/g.50008  ORF Transcript_17539/g.50008 Transcript_17539/m.50008 type:complete len:246 (+) Transcript_17539:746-1483(+)
MADQAAARRQHALGRSRGANEGSAVVGSQLALPHLITHEAHVERLFSKVLRDDGVRELGNDVAVPSTGYAVVGAEHNGHAVPAIWRVRRCLVGHDSSVHPACWPGPIGLTAVARAGNLDETQVCAPEVQPAHGSIASVALVVGPAHLLAAGNVLEAGEVPAHHGAVAAEGLVAGRAQEDREHEARAPGVDAELDALGPGLHAREVHALQQVLRVAGPARAPQAAVLAGADRAAAHRPPHEARVAE